MKATGALALAAAVFSTVAQGRGQTGAVDNAVAPSRPTFTEHIAPLVFEHCAPCHRQDGPAPFPLLSYDDVSRRARQIALVVGRRIMPPWKPVGEMNRFVGDRRLSEDQISLFARWADQGAVEGDELRLPAAPSFSGRWQLGPPDLVIAMPPYRLRAGGDDMYRHFVVATGLTGRRYIKAWQFLPGNRVVHHATLEFDGTGRSRALDRADAEPGYEGLVAPTVSAPDGYFLDWGPGHTPYVAPDGMAWPLEPNTDLVMMLHLRPSGKEEVVQPALGLYFADAPPTRVPSLLRLTRQHMDIPPGDGRYTVTDSYTLPVDVEVHTIQPHAHYLARKIDTFATLPNGTRHPLVAIPDWDFNWQGVYRFAKPLMLPAGTSVRMDYEYDNSSANPSNPSNPPRRVTYGQRTTDEMAELFLQVTTRTSGDRAKLESSLRAKVLREEIVGHEKMIETAPDNVALHDDAALMYVDSGNLDKALKHFSESLRIKPTSPEAHYNVATALMLLGQRTAARDYLLKAIGLKSDYGLAHERLAALEMAEGHADLAIRSFERAADAFAAAGDFERALNATRSALAAVGANDDRRGRLRARAEAYSQRRPYRE
jgi:hypothetical protein